jgi:hypothetical protein
MKKALILLLIITIGCNSDSITATNIDNTKTCTDKIEVLNLGTFHFTQSSDANTSFIDIEDPKVQAEIKELNKNLSKFKPTVILVEATPAVNDDLQTLFWEYCNSDIKMSRYGGETGIVGFEVGRLSQTERIYGIDDHEFRNYDYKIGERNQKTINDPTYAQIRQESIEWDKIDKLPLIERLLQINSQEFRDYIININMDALHYVNSKGTFGATDQALRLYHRNARWFANMNKIDLKSDDRVFILGGAAHTAFLHDMLERSPKFCLIDAAYYLK